LSIKRGSPSQFSPLLHYVSKRRRIYDHKNKKYAHESITTRRTSQTQQHVLIIDTGGGIQPTITTNAWRVTHKYNATISLSGYQSQEPPIQCPVVNAVTKATIPGRDEPVIFEVNYATLVEDERELESLVVPFGMMQHGIQMDLTPPKYGGKGSITIDDEQLRYEFDDEKIFWKIEKPTQDELDTLKWVELNQPKLMGEMVRRKTKTHAPSSNIPWEEWRRRLAMMPEDVVRRTVLDATTQLYMNVENENRDEPREHYQSLCPGLRNHRQRESVASDTYFPTQVTNQGHTCSQLFVGLDSDFWATYPLKNGGNKWRSPARLHKDAWVSQYFENRQRTK
jgi:hypothetical protein